MSQARTSYFFAGDPLRILSTCIHKTTLSTTAPIHSKSHVSACSNLSVISGFINSECLSQSDSTIPFIAPSTSSDFCISSLEKYSSFNILYTPQNSSKSRSSFWYATQVFEVFDKFVFVNFAPVVVARTHSKKDVKNTIKNFFMYCNKIINCEI